MIDLCRACQARATNEFRFRLRGPANSQDWTAPWCGSKQCYAEIRKMVLNMYEEVAS